MKYAIHALLAGHVTLMFANPTATVPHVKAGKLRALGVMDRKRNDALPNVPSTSGEFGELMRVEYERWGRVVKASGAKAD